jgi:hypothetical protein
MDGEVVVDAFPLWDRIFTEFSYFPVYRRTCLSDPGFYRRARSAFGGTHAARVFGRHGMSAFHAAHGMGGHGGG